MKTVELSGACLCGQVKYHVSTQLRKFYFCHCEQCRKLSGSSFASNILAAPAEIQWDAESRFVKRFDYPGEESYTQVFCTECGSPLPFLNEKGTTLFIPAGSLDKAPEKLPDNNIFWADRAAWLEAGVDAAKCEGFPE